MSNFTTIEINGVKLEVDLRTAKRIETLKVGSKVKLLSKKSTYASSKVYPGVIVGFEPFKDRPTIIVAYLAQDWNTAKVEFAYINKENEEFEMIASIDDDLSINKSEVLSLFDKQVAAKRREIEEIEERRAYFLSKFGVHFAQMKEEEVPRDAGF